MQEASDQATKGTVWTDRYGTKHRWTRLSEFPTGIEKPRKVRIYHRSQHYILNWWDAGAGKNISERVNGDLLTALMKAREIDERIITCKTAGLGRHRRIGHADLAEQYLEDLARRANAGEIASGTINRYRAALSHYLTFCEMPAIRKVWPTVSSANRDFRLAFIGFLQNREVRGNGRAGAPAKRMRGQGFIIDTVRALYEWAIDSDRGGLLPQSFKNPFLRTGEKRSILRGDPLAEPDITMTMASDFLQECDEFEFRLFVPIILYGLRAAEPCFIFREHLQSEWLLIPNTPELDYTTKGHRDKRFPLMQELVGFCSTLCHESNQGLLYTRRNAYSQTKRAPHLGKSLVELISIYREQTMHTKLDHASRKRLRDRLFADAGALTYDDIKDCFDRIHKRLRWPTVATLKDFRHLFATTLANAGMPEGYRKYLLGHAPGRDAAVAYTHLNKLREHYGRVVREEYGPVLAIIQNRALGT